MRLGRWALPVVAAAIAGLTVAIVVGGSLLNPTRTETGIVVAVDARSLTDVRAFTIRTSDGRSVAFAIDRLDNAAQFPPGHLLEHKATALAVRVTYRDESGRLLAIRLEDAP